jgi:hypothetical protein
MSSEQTSARPRRPDAYQAPPGYRVSAGSALDGGEPGAWRAPQAGRAGQVSVDRSVLRTVGSQMSADLRELDNAVNRLLSSGRGTGSITGWVTGEAFSGNADNAFTGVMQASSQAGDAHQAVSGRLTDSASTYESAEDGSRFAVTSISAQLNAVSGSISAAGKG